jgi:hypothetical protein
MQLLGRLVEGAEAAPSVLDHLAACDHELQTMAGLDASVDSLRQACVAGLETLQDLARQLDRYGAAMPQLPSGAPQSLLRGMFVEVRVRVDSPGDLVSIPEDAQRPSGDVWVMRDGRLVILKPRAVQVSGGRVVFDSAASGLVAGDRVVTTQLSSPRAGMELVDSAGGPASSTRTADTAGETDAL